MKTKESLFLARHLYSKVSAYIMLEKGSECDSCEVQALPASRSATAEYPEVAPSFDTPVPLYANDVRAVPAIIIVTLRSIRHFDCMLDKDVHPLCLISTNIKTIDNDIL
jgi:hypothetical protein